MNEADNIDIKQNERSVYFDNLKGLLIILVAWSHLLPTIPLAGVSAWIYIVIYLFHMPAFIFISGYFGKSENCRSFDSISKFIILYCVFNAIVAPVEGNFTLTKPNNPYWYICALVVWRLLTPYLSRIRFIIPILLVVSVLVGFNTAIDYPCAGNRILAFWVFYMVGYKAKAEHIKKIKTLKFGSFLAILLLVIVVLILAINSEYMEFPKTALFMRAYGISVIDPLQRCVILFSAFCLIFALLYFMPVNQLPLLTKIGRNSLFVYLIHRWLVYPLYAMKITTSSFGLTMTMLLVAIVWCFILSAQIFTTGLNKSLTAALALLRGQTMEKHYMTVVKCAFAYVAFIYLAYIPLEELLFQLVYWLNK